MKRVKDLLLPPLEHLEQTLAEQAAGREHEWARRVADALAGVEQALRQHAAEAEAPAGLFAKVDLTRPTLARQAGELRAEHATLLERVNALQAEVRNAAKVFQPQADSRAQTDALPEPVKASAIPDFGAIRQSLAQFLADLRRHRDQEVGLVLESVTTDIGAGD
jgi:hypothetical protein